jgi:dTMP kinase
MTPIQNPKSEVQNTPGRFIIIEGIDGTGKSTLARAVGDALKSRGRDVLLTHEPSDLPSGKLILERLASGEFSTTAHEWMGMFIADRRLSIDTIVRPALKSGKDVIQDRSMYSTLVYQGAMGVPEDEILKRHAGWHPQPHLLVILDIAPRFGLARTRKRSLGVGQRWVRQAGQKYMFKDGDAPQSTEKLRFLQEIRRRYGRIKGDFVMHLPARRRQGQEWQDKTTIELRDAILAELDRRAGAAKTAEPIA